MSTATFAEFADRADYSLLETLTPDPEATADGEDHDLARTALRPLRASDALAAASILAHSRSLFSDWSQRRPGGRSVSPHVFR